MFYIKTICLCFSLLLSINLWSQPNLKLGGYKTYMDDFLTYQEQMVGKMESNYIGVEINKIKSNTHIANWELRVRALGDYVNQSNPAKTISSHFTYLEFSTVNQSGMAPVNTGPVQLGTSDVVLLSGTLPLDPQTSGYYLQYKFDYTVQGGNHLLVPNGSYRVPLIFSLYDGNDQLLDSFVLNDIGIQIQTGNYSTNSIVLQNSGDFLSFNFDDVSDYFNGLSISKPLSLKVNNNNPHQIMVKANSDLSSPGSGSIIPVSLFQLEVSQTNESLPALVVSPPVYLSLTEILLVKNSKPNYLYDEVTYDLRFFISPGDAQAISAVPGRYSTVLYFIMLPL